MPRCVMINCKSSKTDSTRQGHISYHSFPHDPAIKEKWIAATGRKYWYPTKHSTICSAHFENSCFQEGKKLRLLKKTAYPTIDILKIVDNDNEATSDDSAQMSEMPVTVKIEVEEGDISEQEEDVLELLENRKRLQEDSIAVDAKKIKVELLPTQSQESQSQYEVVVESPQSKPQSSQFVGVPQPPVQHKCVSQVPQSQAQLPDAEPIVVPEFFMHVVVRNQNEILSILKRQVLLQDPDPELLTFLRFLGSKLLRYPKNKREELQDKITEMLLLQ